MKIELWKFIEDIENNDRYQISSLGRVKDIKGKIPRGQKRRRYIMKQSTNRQGYKMVSIKSKTYPVHRLVAKAFLENPSDKPYVHHIDEDKSNNSVLNLMWVTMSENVNYGTNIERIREKMINNPHRSLKVIGRNMNDYNDFIIFESMAEAHRNGFDSGTISKCCRKKKGYLQHKGYIWNILQ